ncbi:uncharacterized protein LOC128229666 [Mya arenaria]|uniref:uncharacterized protein LOC128229666 n=1 Tax=Mya arenaria TaxID=6604 RepID=UPI0022E82962|nr:uncharacterized protein LOC128229666 [Mya arenaria]
MGKIDLNGQAKLISSVLNKSNDKNSLLKKESAKNYLKNVQIIITSDELNSNSDNVAEEKVNNQVCKNENVFDIDFLKTEPENEIDSDMLTDLNFDLLEDLEKILKADSDGLSCPGDDTLMTSQENDHVKTEQPRGTKRKRSVNEIGAIVDDLKSVEVPSSPVKLEPVDSDYSSLGVPSPYSACSPYSSVDIASPEPVESPLADTFWEESFTELFPDLM